MLAIIQKSLIIPDILSASGVEFINRKIFIIGDDSPFLYVLNEEGSFLEKKNIFIPKELEDRIPKKKKPDLETLTSITYKGTDYVMTFGSGSRKDKRDVGYLINSQTYEATPLSLSILYNSLRERPDIVGEKKLNIEGLAASDTKIILLARGNVSGNNVSISYDMDALMLHLLQGTELPKPEICSYKLPVVDGISSGFSGATYIKDKDILLCTASVEDTSDEITDGTTLGSFIGLIPMKDDQSTFQYALINNNTSAFIGKVESIAIVDISDKLIKAIAVTDSDGGDSELLWLDIIFD